MKILLTGCAGFIGSHVLERLLKDGHTVIGVDNFDPFYARTLKDNNLSLAISHLSSKDQFDFLEADLAEESSYTKLKFIAEGLNALPSQGGVLPPERERGASESQTGSTGTFDAIIHLAAKAGVRPSIEDPVGYQRAGVAVTQYLLEFARKEGIPRFIFGSSSSVYGVSPDVPWSEADAVTRPISPYASTKVSCELLGHVYSHLYGIRFLGLRFFTVYGPRQRPDLAINKFVRLIEAGEPVPVFGDGTTRRDYTFIDDIVEGILGALHYEKTNYEVINLGNDQTVTLSEMIETIETVVGKSAIISRLPEQPGDVPQTWADITKAGQLLGYKPITTFKDGVAKFYDWYKAQKPSF
jgi:UDP-glucuronate 4-epimerase